MKFVGSLVWTITKVTLIIAAIVMLLEFIDARGPSGWGRYLSTEDLSE